ncbi:transcriptional regulator [Halopiger xanaduensis]|uniref:Putative HTH-type transcriptional regulatory protein Halxa_4155 n=1 Tax=Halopiger xanaduensis (strain DSM 18323 / JCM 14033 / SH-6) TaxID=797210 RepID=F8D4Z8_HALXS|nr:transcriptional regulator [Halopiger xanaduensis]AEH38759.1 transcriptional regulator, XRE family [Halopiger xanaduensis SH-6]
MSRSALVGNVTAMLEDAGFVVSDRCAIRPKSFDVAARRGEDLILVKILGNIDAFNEETGHEMRRLGTYLEATPMVIGLRSRDEDLKPDVVYFRHGVPVLSPDTAYNLFIEDVPPLIYAAPGGLYVNIDGDLLADEREDRDWSLGRLANELGVSRRTVSKYEDGMNASVEVAMELQDLFDAPLTSPVNVLDGADEVHETESTPDDPEADPDDERVVAVLTRAGYEVHPTLRSPFKAVSRDEDDADEDVVLTGHSEFTKAAEKRARIMSSIGHVTHTQSVYVVDRAKRESVDGTALVEREELDDLRNAAELRKVIRERSEHEEAA